jgi:TRAP-type C4-dicarboxylate transport system permease large subunit
VANRGNDDFFDGFVSGLIIGLLSSLLWIADLVVRLLIRVHSKYRRNRVMLGIAGTWAAVIALGVVIAAILGSFGVGIATVVSATAVAAIALAIVETALDQRLEQAGVATFTDDLQDWWS